MPRIAIAGLAYHVTHRGNRRGTVFFSAADRETYLRWLAHAAAKHGLDLWAYCLMTNHVHLLVRVERRDSLAGAMRELQGYYAKRINERHEWSGHLWANRHYSHPVEGRHLWSTARYIERNPVRAGMVERAEQYLWSSARAHCGLEGNGVLATSGPFCGVSCDWSSWLAREEPESDEWIRKSARSGRPLGGAPFCESIGRELGRSVVQPTIGRPRVGTPPRG
jgi:putative transposase